MVDEVKMIITVTAVMFFAMVCIFITMVDESLINRNDGIIDKQREYDVYISYVEQTTTVMNSSEKYQIAKQICEDTYYGPYYQDQMIMPNWMLRDDVISSCIYNVLE